MIAEGHGLDSCCLAAAAVVVVQCQNFGDWIEKRPRLVADSAFAGAVPEDTERAPVLARIVAVVVESAPTMHAPALLVVGARVAVELAAPRQVLVADDTAEVHLMGMPVAVVVEEAAHTVFAGTVEMIVVDLAAPN